MARRCNALFTLLICVAFAPPVLAQSPLAWHVRNPLPTGDALYRAASGNGLTLLVGGSYTNIVLVSTNDGTNWSIGGSTGTRTFHTVNSPALSDIVYGDGRFVAVGDACAATSVDGTNWTTYSGFNTWLRSVAFGNGRYVAVGEGASAPLVRSLVSTNGTDWIEGGNAFSSKSVIFAQGRFYLASSWSPEVRVSDDGVNWAGTGGLLFTTLNAITHGGGRFVAVGGNGDIYSSVDATNWSRYSSSISGLNSIAYGNNMFVVVGTGYALTSTNGLNWSQRIISTTPLNGVTFVNGQFIAAGLRGTILTSPNGTNWTARSSRIAALSIERIAWLNDRFVGVGDSGTVVTSSNGVNWQFHFPGTTGTFYGVAGRSNLFVAGGSSTIVSSLDGVTWAPTGMGFSVNSLAYGNGLFVAVGSANEIRTSPDGTNWTTRTSGTSAVLRDVAWGRNMFAAVGNAGTLLVSTNGTNWSSRNPGTSATLGAITFGNGRFHALGRFGGGIATSTNGENWSFSAQPAMTGESVGIAAGAGYVLVVGSVGQTFLSRDLVEWTSGRLRTSYFLYSAAFGDASFVLGGSAGDLWQSDPIVRLMQTGAQSLLISGPNGRSCEIQRNTDLGTANWISFGSVTLSNTPVPWFDPQLNPPPRAFYRGVLPNE